MYVFLQVLLENNYYVSKIKPGRAIINNTKTKEDKKDKINPVHYQYVDQIPKEGHIKSVGQYVLKFTFGKAFLCAIIVLT